MKTLRTAVFLGTLAALAATSAQTQPGPGVGPVCIRPFDTPGPGGTINHTHVVDARTILFYLRDGSVMKNTLKNPCPDLMFHGFVFVTPQDEICANSQAIRVLESNETCQLGDFTPYTPAPGSSTP